MNSTRFTKKLPSVFLQTIYLLLVSEIYEQYIIFKFSFFIDRPLQTETAKASIDSPTAISRSSKSPMASSDKKCAYSITVTEKLQ